MNRKVLGSLFLPLDARQVVQDIIHLPTTMAKRK
jgi:hypothetical protein